MKAVPGLLQNPGVPLDLFISGAHHQASSQEAARVAAFDEASSLQSLEKRMKKLKKMIFYQIERLRKSVFSEMRNAKTCQACRFCASLLGLKCACACAADMARTAATARSKAVVESDTTEFDPEFYGLWL